MNKFKIEHLTYSVIEGQTNKYFLELNKRRYYVGLFVIEILELLRDQKSYKEIALELNKNHNTVFFNEQSVQKTVEQDFVEQGILQNESNPYNENMGFKKYIYGRVNFLKSENHPKLLQALSFLYKPSIFITLTVISILITIFFLSKKEEIITSLETNGTLIFTILFLFSIINTLWHEIGHATASYSNGVMPKDIGFGFYIVYPIFFTDVSDIWKLNKKKRNIVNIGGIYFQLIANIILAGLYCTSSVFWIVPTLIVFNTGVAFMSLNPFFRYDGYWVYSDYFNLPNLRTQSFSFIKSVFKKIKGNKEESWKEIFSKPIPLIIYSIGSNLFFIAVSTALIWGSISQGKAIIDIIKNIELTGWSEEIIVSIIKKMFLIGMLLIFIAWTIKSHNKK